MKETLFSSHKIQIRRSPIHGWGVFAKFDIVVGEILEEVPFLKLPIKKGESTPLLIDYRFNFPSGGDFIYQVIPVGFGCVYNHSNTPNAEWYTDTENEIFIFRAIKNIKQDSEIFVFYGDSSYWNDGRSRIQVA